METATVIASGGKALQIPILLNVVVVVDNDDDERDGQRERCIKVMSAT